MATNKNENIHENHRQRLKDRFINNPQSLNKHELLELLLFYAIPRKNVNPDAHRLLDKFGSINGVLNASPAELMNVENIGTNTVAFLKTINSLISIISEEKQDAVKLYSLASVKDYLINFFSNYDKEVFFAFLLSKTNKIITKIQFTSGKVDEISFLTSEFNKAFANANPYAVVIAHNHPSENPEPSKKDDAATEKLYLSFSLSGVKLYDHVIVGGNKIYSYRTDGRLYKIIESINDKFGI
jgi:DNA repair protein RadC